MIGSIVLWYGELGSLPAGWQICDGTNGTPDLRNKFAVGADRYGTHPETTVTGPNLETGGAATQTAVLNLGAAILESGAADLATDTQAFSIVPPFRALYYIMRLS